VSSSSLPAYTYTSGSRVRTSRNSLIVSFLGGPVASRKPAPKKNAAAKKPAKVAMPAAEFKAEHQRLLKVLKSADHVDDKAEFKKQSAEMKKVLKPKRRRKPA
jgi:hypothetical protein